MATLTSDLRKTLERTVIKARDLAEEAVCAAVQGLGVGASKAPTHLKPEQQELRRRLRAHGRALGDRLHKEDAQEVRKLVQEGAYEHWHRMLFARFLAENGLLLHPELGVGMTLAECEELAQEEGCQVWELAGRFASRMLPQIFRPADPVLQIKLAPEHQQALEKLLAELPIEVFTADDSLGWVYQFWQAKRKDEVNASEVKIGAEELPAVTQLFTEDYMVDFLLHNSLGAWWVTRHPGVPSPVPMPYLRTLEDGTPAAGKFEGWPDCLKDFTLLDPCCGSGHFLVAAFRLLVALRKADEGLSAAEAVDAVLSQNIHGLELDARCVEIAVFALALAAWTTPGEDGRPLGVRPGMPGPAVACCGLKPAAKVEEWLALVPEDHLKSGRLKAGLQRLHSTFQQASLLGSLLDPGREAGGLYEADYEELEELLTQALVAEDGATSEQVLSAKGLMAAAKLLSARYNLVITNVPYLARGKQEDALKEFCALHYHAAKSDLANVFLDRCLELSCQRGEGVVQIVMPQNWLFLASYKNQREYILKNAEWKILARLGSGAFETISGEVVQAILFTALNVKPNSMAKLTGIDAINSRSSDIKADILRSGKIQSSKQNDQLKNPNHIISFTHNENKKSTLLRDLVKPGTGMQTFDLPRFIFKMWELEKFEKIWKYSQSTVDRTCLFGGCEDVVRWEEGVGSLFHQMESLKAQGYTSGIWRAGSQFWGRKGLTVSLMGDLPCSLYLGYPFNQNTGVLMPNCQEDLLALWAMGESGELSKAVREIDQSLKVTNGTVANIRIDIEYWRKIAVETYPNGLPKPYSDDPTQWLFHGHPRPSLDPLQVGLARLVGYRWPAETHQELELSDDARTWIACSGDLDALVDDDGILPIPAMRGEQPAEGRLRQMLAKAFGADWSTAKEQELLQSVGYGGKSLEAWLRDGFFEQHCKLFQQRPFIWQVWDGLRDGFSVLVNYHKLDRKGLESLTYSYLGDWITRQKDAVARKESGAPGKLEKALELQKKLVTILEGEAPYDIFVRWKPLDQQPIGWEPDLNDGVRLNIRPFMTAGVLRKDPKINWNKDRGTDVESAPWYHLGPHYGGKKGDRINDHHLKLEEKREARAKAAKP